MIFNTAFSITKSRFKSWPVIKTDDTTDYTLADEFKDKSQYVWLYNDKYTINDSFDWNYFPDKETNISVFPYCVRETKKPLNWNVLRLVPTDSASRITEVKLPIIAAYRNSIEDVYMCNYSRATQDFKRFKENKPSFYPSFYITNANSFDDVIMGIDTSQIGKFVWLIDSNVNVSDEFDFSSEDLSEEKVYMYSVKHSSTKMSYGYDGLARLVSKQYITDYQNSNDMSLYETVLVNQTVGTINDLRDPYVAWIYGYNTRVMMKDNNQRELYNTIIRIFRKLDLSFSGKYASKGFNQAQRDIDAGVETPNHDMSNAIDAFNDLKKKLEAI